MDFLVSQLTVLEAIFDWRTIADIFLLTVLIFFLLRTFRLLGTTKIFYGLLAALLIFLAARLLGLKGMNWVFANFSHVALLGFIVIFQPEIRRLLERAGSYRGQIKAGIKGDLFSMQLAEVAFSLAEKGWGALFVLPGKESIQPWISDGVVMDAAISEPLVMSLFDPHSPGHDGAVIVESGKMSQFGVRLPLSKSGQLSNNYGTRHHAAMGLSEVTDALVLLVSEERKRVSLFLAGKMIRVKDKGGILAGIQKHLEEVSVFGFRAPSKSGFSAHAAEIVLSFLAATVFCATVVVSQAEIREKAFSVPVEYLTSEDTALGGEKVSDVMVHLKGPKSELDLLRPSDLSVRIDLKKTGAGIADVMITDDNLKLPRGISLLDVQPDSLKLTLRLIQEKEAIVDPQLVGSLPEGLKLVSIRVLPGKVRVLSPEGEPGEEDPHVTTTPIYLDGIKGDTKILCKIVAPPSIQPVQKTWPDAEVEIVVDTKEDQKTYGKPPAGMNR